MVTQIKSNLKFYCFQIQIDLLSLLRPPVTSPRSDKICILPFVVDYRSCRQRRWQGYHVENNISSSLSPICNVLFTPPHWHILNDRLSPVWNAVWVKEGYHVEKSIASSLLPNYNVLFTPLEDHAHWHKFLPTFLHGHLILMQGDNWSKINHAKASSGFATFCSLWQSVAVSGSQWHSVAFIGSQWQFLTVSDSQ